MNPRNLSLWLMLSIVIINSIQLSGCQSQEESSSVDEAIIRTQAAETVMAGIVETGMADALNYKVTDTPAPTITLKPIMNATSTEVASVESLLIDLADLLEQYGSEFGGVESVTTIRPGSDSLEVELKTKWASQDRQPDVSFEVIKVLADIFGDPNRSEEKNFQFVTGTPSHFSILLTTYSNDGAYKYSSLTYYDTLVKLANKQITYDEWVKESGAKFAQ